MSRKMSLKESDSVVPPGQPPLFSKFKSRTKDAESPKSVILDPRIVSPASSASASLERRLTDLKKQPRHDRVHSISDTDDETALVGVNLSVIPPPSREQLAKGSNGHLLLEPVSEVHSLPSPAYRKAHISGPSSETSSPRNRMSRTAAGKDSLRCYVRGSYDGEFLNRKMSSAGADAATSSVLGPLPHSADQEGVDTKSLACSLPKSTNHGVSGNGSDRTARNAAGCIDGVPNSLQNLAREPVQATRLEKEDNIRAVNLQSEVKDLSVGSMYSILMNGFYGPSLEETISGRGLYRSDGSLSKESSIVKNDSGIAYEDQIELNKFVVRGMDREEIKAGEQKIGWSEATPLGHRILFSGDCRSNVSGYRPSKACRSIFSPGDSPGHSSSFNEMHNVQKVTYSPSTKTVGNGENLDKSATYRSMDGWRKPFESHEGSAAASTSLFVDGSTSLHPLPSLESHAGSVRAVPEISESHGSERSSQYGGRIAGSGDTSKASLMPQQRFVPGQFLNPLKPRQPPAKWDDAEKWLVNPASVKSGTAYQHGNGQISGGSTPQHTSQSHPAGSGRHQNSRSCRTSGDLSLGFVESYDAKLITEDGDGGPNSYAPRANFICQERRLSVDGNVSEAPCGDDAFNPFEVQVHPLPDVNSIGQAKANSLSAVNKVVRLKSEGEADDLRESADLQHAKKNSDSLRVNTIEGHVCDQQQCDPFAATINDQFTKDKFADCMTVQSTSSNYGREFVVMKDAATEITPSSSQRDMATQVTPVPSFHAVVTPPRIHTGEPTRLNTTPVHSERRPASLGVDVTELQSCHKAKLELQQAAALGTNWPTREEEVEESARSLRLSRSVSRNVDIRDVQRNVLEARATAWEEAEQSRYISRFHREEAKIQAWEVHQKAKAETDMRKTEVKLERMRSHANELLQNKLACVHLRAENMRANAAAECGEQAVKTNHWAQEIRTSGRSPSPTLLCCFPRRNSSSPWS